MNTPVNPRATPIPKGWSEQEKYLYGTHLRNLRNAPVLNPDESVSTLRTMSFEENGKVYNIPTVWDGKVVDPDEAIRRARKLGLNKFPSYKSDTEAEGRYGQMHQVMEQDVQKYRRSKSLLQRYQEQK